MSDKEPTIERRTGERRNEDDPEFKGPERRVADRRKPPKPKA
jgi:hypothetical protein